MSWARTIISSLVGPTPRESAPRLDGRGLRQPRASRGKQSRFNPGQLASFLASPVTISSSKFLSLSCQATLTVKEDVTGVEFPLVQQFWESLEMFRSMGASSRSKKIAFINVKVYAMTLYLEAEKAAREFKIRDKGDFMKSGSDSDFCDVMLDGAFHKVLQIRMVRNITSEQFIDAIDRRLRSKMEFMGQLAPLEEFAEFISGQKLNKGTDLLLFWHVQGFLDVAVVPGSIDDFSKTIPGKRIESPSLSRALYELYLGEDPVIPDAKKSWAGGARLLLESTEI
ncbi:hypothetical protein BSKO_09198 [Bryopsis sp. KO-2023]|nr:hypothetical protein BSKO_09198 [Bryopsis sp. KO-2023]